MEQVLRKPVAAAIVLALASGLAQAMTIGFDPLVNDGSAWSSAYAQVGDTYRESGYTFASTPADGYGFYAWSRNSPLNGDPGGATLVEPFGGTLTVTRTDGGSFSLKSFDLTDIYNAGTPGSITMTWTDASGTHTRQLALPDSTGLHTYAFGYAGVTSFALEQGAPYFQLDNVRVSAVPEPAALALMLAGLAAIGALGASRRRAAPARK
jgi:hypothetical protein